MMKRFVSRIFCALPVIAFFSFSGQASAQDIEAYGTCVTGCLQGAQQATGYAPGQFTSRCQRACEGKHLGSNEGAPSGYSNYWYEWWWSNCATGQCKNNLVKPE